MNWTKETVDEVCTYLEQSHTVIQAVEQFNEGREDKISTASLRSAFKRLGLNSPSHYLKDLPVLEEQSQPDTVELLFEDFVKKDDDTGIYHIFYDSDDYHLSYELAEKLVVWYADSPRGMGFSLDDCYIRYHELFYETFGVKSNLRKDVIKFFLSQIGQTKSLSPELPHQSHEPPIVVDKEMRLVREAEKRRLAKTSLWKEVEELKERNAVLEQVLDQMKAQHHHEASYRFHPKNLSESYGAVTWLIPLSDWHFGKKEDPKRFSPKNHNVFNKEILKNRVEKIAKIIQTRNLKNIDHIHMSFLGDLFEGLFGNMREGQSVFLDALGDEQYYLVRDAMKFLISTMAKRLRAENLHGTVLIQGGNHDRLHKDKSYESEDLMSLVLADLMKAEFKEYGDVLEIAFGGAWASFTLPCGTNVVTSHGHWNKKPPSSASAVKQILDIWGKHDAKRKVLIMGHYHNFQVLTGYNFRFYQLPSLCGNDKYNRGQVMVGSDPEFVSFDMKEGAERIIGPVSLL